MQEDLLLSLTKAWAAVEPHIRTAPAAMSVQGASPESSLTGDSPPVSIADGQPLDFLDLEFWPAETDFRLDQMASTMEWLGQLDAQAGGNPLAGQQPGGQQSFRGDGDAVAGVDAAIGQQQHGFQSQGNGADADMAGVSIAVSSRPLAAVFGAARIS